MTTQVNRIMEPMVNVVQSTMTSQFEDFVRIYSPIFLGSMVGENLREFLDGVYKVLIIIRMISREKVGLASYQMMEVAQVWYTKKKDNRSVELRTIEWEEFKKPFFDKYLLHVSMTVEVRN